MVKQMHMPFEDWLLTDKPLAPEQDQALQAHLQTCESCRQRQTAWASVSTLFERAEPAAPTVGFVARWQERLTIQRRQKQRRQTLFFFILLAGIAALFLLALSAQAVLLLRSPAQLLLFKTAALSLLAATAEFMVDFSAAVARIPSALILTGLVFSTGLICFWSVLWYVTFHQLMTRRNTV